MTNLVRRQAIQEGVDDLICMQLCSFKRGELSVVKEIMYTVRFK
jgi:hypothetical protein